MKLKTSHELKSNWVWKQKEDDEDVKELVKTNVEAGVDGWRAVSSWPSEIHVELLKNELIPDPFIGFNEHLIQCE